MVRLAPMNEGEFQAYREEMSVRDTRNFLKAERWTAAAARNGAEQASRYPLPEDLASLHQYLLMIEDEQFGFKVGALWFEVRDEGMGPVALIHDLSIFERFRRRHYGTHAFRALEQYVRKLGITTIRLHIFGENLAARSMYEKLGFLTTDVLMEKTFGKPGG